MFILQNVFPEELAICFALRSTISTISTEHVSQHSFCESYFLTRSLQPILSPCFIRGSKGGLPTKNILNMHKRPLNWPKLNILDFTHVHIGVGWSLYWRNRTLKICFIVALDEQGLITLVAWHCFAIKDV